MWRQHGAGSAGAPMVHDGVGLGDQRCRAQHAASAERAADEQARRLALVAQIAAAAARSSMFGANVVAANAPSLSPSPVKSNASTP